MKNKLITVLLTACISYSALYFFIIEDMLIDIVNLENESLYEKVKNVEPLGYEQDGEDSYYNVYTDEDQELVNKYEFAIEEKTGLYSFISFIATILAVVLGFYKYGLYIEEKTTYRRTVVGEWLYGEEEKTNT